ncbi:MAG TPA: hypothetical protein VF088_03185 [Pyrinomonadaceae bacterium]
MYRISLILGLSAFLVTLVPTAALVQSPREDRLTKPYTNFELDVLVDGRPLSEYYSRGRTYVEALHGAEYELRLRNDSPDRVAVALSVDGLNTIDARHTSAWNASKWVIEPYQTITISGWQMSSERARRFYFTNERDSYGAKLGQTENLGVIAAVFFRERRRVITPPPYPITRDKTDSDMSGRAQSAPRDEQAATGIGRNVRNDVRWVDMDLESRPAGEVTIRYEYRWQRRDDPRGFCPEPRN